MKDEHILWRLAGWMHAKGFTEAQVEAFVARWRQLREHDARPCPVCFTREVEELREQPLAAMPERGMYEPLVCPHCKTEILVEIPT